MWEVKLSNAGQDGSKFLGLRGPLLEYLWFPSFHPPTLPYAKISNALKGKRRRLSSWLGQLHNELNICISWLLLLMVKMTMLMMMLMTMMMTLSNILYFHFRRNLATKGFPRVAQNVIFELFACKRFSYFLNYSKHFFKHIILHFNIIIFLTIQILSGILNTNTL